MQLYVYNGKPEVYLNILYCKKGEGAELRTYYQRGVWQEFGHLLWNRNFNPWYFLKKYSANASLCKIFFDIDLFYIDAVFCYFSW
jgi:hypothetical protein